MQPRIVTDIELAFPVSVDGYLPRYGDVPADFKQWSGNEYVQFITDWFFKGADASRLVAREGIDRKQALRHIQYCLGSFEPRHEHKEAGCAYLLSQWFTIAPVRAVAPAPTKEDR